MTAITVLGQLKTFDISLLINLFISLIEGKEHLLKTSNKKHLKFKIDKIT